VAFFKTSPTTSLSETEVAKESLLCHGTIITEEEYCLSIRVGFMHLVESKEEGSSVIESIYLYTSSANSAVSA